jgi:hypothetical protein
MVACNDAQLARFHITDKLKNKASVYSVFPCHAYECANLSCSDHLYLHFFWKCLVMFFCIFHGGYTDVLPLLPVFVLLSTCFPFEPNRCHLPVATEGWWSFRMHHFLPSQKQFTTYLTPYVQATLLYKVMSLYTLWEGPEHCLKTHASKNILDQELKISLHWDVTICIIGFLWWLESAISVSVMFTWLTMKVLTNVCFYL